VPTYLACKCSNWLLMLNLSDACMVENLRKISLSKLKVRRHAALRSLSEQALLYATVRVVQPACTDQGVFAAQSSWPLRCSPSRSPSRAAPSPTTAAGCGPSRRRTVARWVLCATMRRRAGRKPHPARVNLPRRGCLDLSSFPSRTLSPCLTRIHPARCLIHRQGVCCASILGWVP
jgi:hypothetical protein